MRPFRIYERTIYPDLNRISDAERTVQVEPRVMQVLVCLVLKREQVLTREELLDAVWTGTIVNEESLTRAISDLRRILDDDPRSPRIVETIRKSGSRCA